MEYRKLSAMFSNIDGHGNEYTFIGCDIHESVVDNINTELPRSFKAHFYYGECEIPETDQFNDVDTRIWFLPQMAHKGIHIAYDKETKLYKERI